MFMDKVRHINREDFAGDLSIISTQIISVNSRTPNKVKRMEVRVDVLSDSMTYVVILGEEEKMFAYFEEALGYLNEL